MEAILSEEVRAGLAAARSASLRKGGRLRLEVNGRRHAILRMWHTGFALDPKEVPQLRGLVDVYDGAIYRMRCLVVAGDEVDGEMQYEFKRATPVSEAPALDFVREAHAPVALIDNVQGVHIA